MLKGKTFPANSTSRLRSLLADHTGTCAAGSHNQFITDDHRHCHCHYQRPEPGPTSSRRASAAPSIMLGRSVWSKLFYYPICRYLFVCATVWLLVDRVDQPITRPGRQAPRQLLSSPLPPPLPLPRHLTGPPLMTTVIAMTARAPVRRRRRSAPYGAPGGGGGGHLTRRRQVPPRCGSLPVGRDGGQVASRRRREYRVALVVARLSVAADRQVAGRAAIRRVARELWLELEPEQSANAPRR